MYSNKRHVLELVALLLKHGITKVVLCPGSRNIPIVETISNIPEFSCYRVTDERSAAFFAMGMAIHGGNPVAVCCTSGTAVANMYSAVAEAYYQKVPLLVISADRPRAWLGQMDGQTIPQQNIFGSLVKKSVDIQEIKTEEDIWYANRLINEAILSMSHNGKGPAHVNVQIEEPFFDFTVKQLPEVRVIERYHGLNLYEREYQPLIDKLNANTRRMVVIGQMNLIYLFDKKYSKGLYKNFVWVGENLMNRTSPGNVINNIDQILYALDKDQRAKLKPNLLITYGGHIISKRLKKFLRDNPPQEHWHISEDGEIVDLFASLTTVIQMNPFEFMERISSFIETSATEYPRMWENFSKSLTCITDIPYSPLSVLKEMFGRLDSDCSLHLANSSAVRYAQLFDLPYGVEVLSNRGTNGIDGSLSTAMGYSVFSKKINYIVIGDLSFFYDMNALSIEGCGCNIRILVINNHCGEIFKALSGLSLSDKGCKAVVGSHRMSAKAWAIDRGFEYMSIENDAGISEKMDMFTVKDITPKPLLMEVFTNADSDIEVLKQFYHQMKIK